jgi:tRNA(adenine34) deaminase
MGAREQVMAGRNGNFDSWMQQALIEARVAGEHGDIPIGAVVVDAHGTVLAVAGNRREVDQDPTAHAEVLALREAARQVGDWRLSDCTLVVTVEPCPMCAGAIVLSRISTLVLGAWNDDYGAAGSRWDLVRDRRLNHQVEVVGGIRAEECSALLKDFLAHQRGDANSPSS